MKKIIVSEELPKVMVDKITSIFGYEVLKCRKYSLFDDAMASHPDMNYLNVGNKLFTISDVVALTKPQAEKLQYPNDVLLNAFCVGDDFICKTDSVFSEALEYAKAIGMNIIHVNQGYLKCNLVVVNENAKAVITEDKGIAKILAKYGYDVLLLNEHAVSLKPYEHGFIGGASGNIEGKIVFTGSIENHPEFDNIKSFLDKHSVEFESLSNETLYDYGSVLMIDM